MITRSLGLVKGKKQSARVHTALAADGVPWVRSAGDAGIHNSYHSVFLAFVVSGHGLVLAAFHFQKAFSPPCSAVIFSFMNS